MVCYTYIHTSSVSVSTATVLCSFSTVIIACYKRDSNCSTRMYLIMQGTFDKGSLPIAAGSYIYRAVNRYKKTMFALSLYFKMTRLTPCGV